MVGHPMPLLDPARLPFGSLAKHLPKPAPQVDAQHLMFVIRNRDDMVLTSNWTGKIRRGCRQPGRGVREYPFERQAGGRLSEHHQKETTMSLLRTRMIEGMIWPGWPRGRKRIVDGPPTGSSPVACFAGHDGGTCVSLTDLVISSQVLSSNQNNVKKQSCFCALIRDICVIVWFNPAPKRHAAAGRACQQQTPPRIRSIRSRPSPAAPRSPRHRAPAARASTASVCSPSSGGAMR